MTWTVHHGDCLEHMRGMADCSVDAVVTDPPYGLGKPPPIADLLRAWLADEDHDHLGGSGGFMGKAWDAMVPHPRIWREVFRVLKPGGHIVCFAGQRTVDLMGISLRLAEFEPRDLIGHQFYSGFPKSLNVSKAIDAAAGAVREVVGTNPNVIRSQASIGRVVSCNTGTFSGDPDITAPATPEAEQWEGFGTALKPCIEPAILARKPLGSTVAACVLKWGTGALNIDACRYAYGDTSWPGPQEVAVHADVVIPDRPEGSFLGLPGTNRPGDHPTSARYAANGRWPANIYATPKASRSEREAGLAEAGIEPVAGFEAVDRAEGSAGLTPAAGSGRTASEIRNTHPCVKPIDLMSWLVRLVTPPGGLVLDPFCGSGTTGIAAACQGFDFIGCELDERFVRIARARIDYHTKSFRDDAIQGGFQGLAGLPLFGAS